ncbi:MAG: glycoside hydrolase, partial [Chloroflexi bacterium]|nr:glycoside hydrolase [Chloroflexota bacterium]
MQTKASRILALTFLLCACAATPDSPVVPSPAFVTATLPPTATAAATQTPLPPTPAPTAA